MVQARNAIMPNRHSQSPLRRPPQLFGIYEDAAQIGANTFRLEVLPHAIMASFSVRNQAGEIDFKFEAGREMIDYLLSLPGVRKKRRGRGVIEYRERTIPRNIELEAAARGQERLSVSWEGVRTMQAG